jgi:hypothetical protein
LLVLAPVEGWSITRCGTEPLTVSAALQNGDEPQPVTLRPGQISENFTVLNTHRFNFSY